MIRRTKEAITAFPFLLGRAVSSQEGGSRSFSELSTVSLLSLSAQSQRTVCIQQKGRGFEILESPGDGGACRTFVIFAGALNLRR